jgi:hypothetical protein
MGKDREGKQPAEVLENAENPSIDRLSKVSGHKEIENDLIALRKANNTFG